MQRSVLSGGWLLVHMEARNGPVSGVPARLFWALGRGPKSMGTSQPVAANGVASGTCAGMMGYDGSACLCR